MLFRRSGYHGQSLAAFQAVLAAIAIVATAVLQISATAAPDTVGVWAVDQKLLKRVDPASNQFVQTLSLQNTAADIAYDGKTETLWALANKRLLKFNAAGTLTADYDLSPPSQPTEALKHLALNPYNGSLWVAGEKTILRVSPQGQTLLKWTSTQNIQAVDFDPDESLWVLTQGSLYQLSPSGALLNNIAIPNTLIPDPIALAVDGLGGYLWVAGKKTLVRYDSNALTQAPLVAPVPPTIDGTTNKIEALLTHPLFGTVWAAGTPALLLYDRDGALLRQVDTLALGIGASLALAYDYASASLWLGGKLALGRFTANGDFVTKLPAATAITAVTVGPFSVSPTLTLLSPQNNSFTNNPRPPFRLGLGAECNGAPCELVDAYTQSFALDATLNGTAIGSLFSLADREALYIPPTRLPEGVNLFSAQATDVFGHLSNRVDSQFTVDTIPPQFLNVSPADGSSIATAQVTVSGQVDDPTASVMLQNSSGAVLNVGGANFSFAVNLAQGLNSFTLTATDPAGNATQLPYRLTFNLGPVLNPSPINPTVATTLKAATEFLYTGPDAVQSGVNPATIDPSRIAVVRGKVFDRDRVPIASVIIRVLNHPEFGATQSRTDGLFDLAVNGGGVLTVVYEKPGYLPAQRQVNAPWQDYVHVDDVILLPVDSKVTTIDLNAPIPIQVAQGNVVTDADGTRQATVLFSQGVSATMVLPDGSSQPLTTLNVRATEYTVGPDGPKAMPAPLPTNSAYTYAVELSVDEAIAANAKTVVFSQPVHFYLDNFLNFPVGGNVPAGYYDRGKGIWIPSNNGKVIKILSTSGGIAVLDTNGDGAPDTATQLAALGITDAERAQLATLYSDGKTLWRVPITHFTPWDCNWPFGPPPTAAPPGLSPPPPPNRCSDKKQGSIIECQDQVLGESVNIAGTTFSLNYRSNRVPGSYSAYTITIPLSSETIPTPLKRIELEVAVAGRKFTSSYPASPNQLTDFTWDGQDAHGRILQGSQPVTIRVGYVYDGVYQQANRFGYTGNGIPITGSRTRQEVTLWQQMHSGIGPWDARNQGLGAWSLDRHHAFDPISRILYLGNGERRAAQSLSSVISTVAGGGTNGDGVPATAALLSNPHRIALDAAGNLFIAQTSNNRIRKVSTDGIISTVAGGGSGGDGSPATAASLPTPWDVAVDATGNLFIPDINHDRIRKVSADGIISTIAGGNGSGYSGDGGPATAAQLRNPFSVAVDADGNIFIADTFNDRIRKISPDGIITTVAGGGPPAARCNYSGPATGTTLYSPYGVTVDTAGNLFIADTNNGCVRKLAPSGIITTVASGLSGPFKVAVDASGNVFIAESYNNRVRKVSSEGVLTTVAGNSSFSSTGDGGPPTAAGVREPYGVAVDSAGNLFIADTKGHRVRKVTPALPGHSGTELSVSSVDGSEVYQFSALGRHLRTLNALTGAVIYQFTYDATGYLTAVQDGDGNITFIERNGATPTAIIAPDGQRTTLVLDANGYLAAVTNPAGETTAIGSAANGLLTHFSSPRGHTSVKTYDSSDRLIRDENPAGGFWALSRTEADRTYEVNLTSALGRQNLYRVESLISGDERRTNVLPDGTIQISLRNVNESTTTTAPDGTITTTALGPDPRFSMVSPLPKTHTVKTPSGLTSVATTTRTATLADPSNLLSLTSQTEQVTRNGRTSTSVFVVSSRTLTVTSPASRKTTSTLDAQGRPLQSQVTGLSPLQFTYDGRGRLTGVSQGSGAGARTSTIVYNPQGYAETFTDPAGQVTRFDYDLAGRVTRQTLPDGRVITWSYDANGNVIGITPPGRPPHTFNYTPVDLEERYSPPNAGLPVSHTQYAYNLDKQLTNITRPDGQTINFAYDSAGRLATMAMPHGTLTHGYLATGQLATLASPGGVAQNFTYDGFLPLAETWAGPVNGTVSRSYNTDFRTTSISVNGSPIAFGYDNDTLLTQAGALAITRSPQHGMVTGTALGSTTTSQVYNGFGELADFQSSHAGAGLLAFTLTRDARGNITQKSETVQGQTDVYGYSYDATGRLIEVTKNGAVQSMYSYDANGNRLPGTYDDQDRLLSQGATTYTYTANGELKTKTTGAQTTSYTYDVLGNLTNVALPNGTAIEYVIDGRSRRVGKKVNGALTQGFLYEDQLRPAAELDGTGSIVARFVYADKVNAPEYMIKGAQTYRIITDHLGSPRLVINASNGNVEQRLDFDEFGNVINDSNPGFQPFGFAGGLYDKDTKLTRFGARDYDPETGRWTSQDPILFEGGDTNLYSYVLNDPVNFIDPVGLKTMPDPPKGPPKGPKDLLEDGLKDPRKLFSCAYRTNSLDECMVCCANPKEPTLGKIAEVNCGENCFRKFGVTCPEGRGLYAKL